MGARTSFWQTLIATAASALLVVGTCAGGGGGCGGGGGTGSSGGSAGTTGGGGTTGGSSAGLPYTGTLILADINGSEHTAIVEFTATTAEAAACAGGTQSGSCCYEPPPSTSGGSLTFYNAGTLTVTDGSATIGTDSFSTTTSDYGSLSSITTPAFTWNPGDTLGVSAAGATLDSFNVTIKAPGAIGTTTPAVSEVSPVTVPLSADWPLSWTPDATQSGETVILSLTDSKTNGGITCTVPDSSGTVSVPSALLGHFNSGDSASVGVVRYAGNSVSSANTKIDILAQAEIFGTATLQ
jgi:hypothetical protein